MQTPLTDYHLTSFSPIKLISGLLLCLMPFYVTSSSIPNLLERIIQGGVLAITSSNGPVTYYEGPFGFTGFEYELANAFADELGVELAIIEEPNLQDQLSLVTEQTTHLAANTIAVTDSRAEQMRFSAPYLFTPQQVIYRRGEQRPRKVEDLMGKDIVVLAGSTHAEYLARLKQEHPELEWREIADAEPADLIEAVHLENAELSIVDSTSYTINRNLYPRARAGFDLTEPQAVAWAFPKNTDDSLYHAANQFLDTKRASGKLAELEQKYFNSDDFDVGGALAFSSRIESRLPKWESFFRKAATEFKLDWLLLAAISYQESLWNQNARSYTGVRGLMMLTQATARQVGIKNRVDPQQSIYGGAKYFTRTLGRIPERIENPDRVWMALAAYNVGFGHLEDARKLTEQQGGDPDVWLDIKERLPLLAKKKYYSQTKHGYARGWEPVTYVENIQNYYNILVLRENEEQKRIAAEKEKPPILPKDYAGLEAIGGG